MEQTLERVFPFLSPVVRRNAGLLKFRQLKTNLWLLFGLWVCLVKSANGPPTCRWIIVCLEEKFFASNDLLSFFLSYGYIQRYIIDIVTGYSNVYDGNLNRNQILSYRFVVRGKEKKTKTRNRWPRRWILSITLPSHEMHVADEKKSCRKRSWLSVRGETISPLSVVRSIRTFGAEFFKLKLTKSSATTDCLRDRKRFTLSKYPLWI